MLQVLFQVIYRQGFGNKVIGNYGKILARINLDLKNLENIRQIGNLERLREMGNIYRNLRYLQHIKTLF
jgi:hypothetical protein